MNNKIYQLGQFYQRLNHKIDILQAPALLASRLYIAWVFFASGLTKLRDWETTLFLFEEEYSVPLLNYEFAAWLATGGELLLPILLALGIATRFSSAGLTIVNIVAVLSLQEIAAAAFTLHVVWGLILLQILFWGADKLSVDAWLKYRLLLERQSRKISSTQQ